MLNFNILMKALKNRVPIFTPDFKYFGIISEHDRIITAFTKEIFYLRKEIFTLFNKWCQDHLLLVRWKKEILMKSFT